jgi:membrane fusion protein (multidrug efflux system)
MRVKLKKLVLFLIIAAVIILLNSCGNSSSSQTNNEEEDPGVPVETVKVIQGSISATYTGSASLEAEAEAEVVAKVSGVVKEIYVEESDPVIADQVLAKLDDEQLLLELNQAKTRLDQLSKEFERNESLLKNKIASQETYEKTKSEYHSQIATCDLAQLRLDYTEIKAPIRGIISLRHIKVGNMVNINQPAFHIMDFDPLLAVLHIPEKEMGKLQIGYPANLSADALPGVEFKGEILRISPVVNAGTGTVKVTVVVDDRTRQLKPGMFTRIQIIYDTHENTLLVPKNAVITEDSESSVFLLDEDTVSKRIVEIGYNNSTHTEILSGLNVGDTIVSTGLSSLKDGSKVNVVSQ